MPTYTDHPTQYHLLIHISVIANQEVLEKVTDHGQRQTCLGLDLRGATESQAPCSAPRRGRTSPSRCVCLYGSVYMLCLRLATQYLCTPTAIRVRTHMFVCLFGFGFDLTTVRGREGRCVRRLLALRHATCDGTPARVCVACRMRVLDTNLFAREAAWQAFPPLAWCVAHLVVF